MTDDGGDAACWLDRVCDCCGGLVDERAAHTCRRAEAAGVPDGASSLAPTDDGLS